MRSQKPRDISYTRYEIIHPWYNIGILYEIRRGMAFVTTAPHNCAPEWREEASKCYCRDRGCAGISHGDSECGVEEEEAQLTDVLFRKSRKRCLDLGDLEKTETRKWILDGNPGTLGRGFEDRSDFYVVPGTGTAYTCKAFGLEIGIITSNINHFSCSIVPLNELHNCH